MKIPVALLVACTSAAPAAVIVNYDFGNEQARTAPTQFDPGVTVSDFFAHGSIGVTNRPVIYPGWAAAPTSEVVGTSQAPGTEATARAENDYFSLTITPTPGNALTLTSLNFTTAFYTASGAANLTGNFFVRTSIDDFAVTVGGIFSETHVVSASPEFTPRQVLFSGSQYQNLTAPVTIRIYLYDASNSPTRYLAVDDVLVGGEITAIPETSATLLFAGALAPIIRRKRRRAVDFH